MGALHLLIATVCIQTFTSSFAFDCKQIQRDTEIKTLDWKNLEECIVEIGRSKLSRNSSESIWHLIKNVNNGLENIAPSVYANMGNILLGISMEDLRNITMDVVEIVKAFGSIREGFSDDKLNLIARKVRNEWYNKNPDTYSEYDLISMGQIVCYLNGSDIERIHADAFRYAAEWIGKLKNCPVDRIQAFARLSVHSDAFGHPSNWSKLDVKDIITLYFKWRLTRMWLNGVLQFVSIMGNLIKGLSLPEIEAIGKAKLRLNKYFKKASRTSNSTNIQPSN